MSSYFSLPKCPNWPGWAGRVRWNAPVFSFLTLTLCAWGAERRAEVPSVERVREIAAMLPRHATGLGKAITNRAAWEAPAVQAALGEAVKSAAAMAKTPMPESPDDLYLDYSRTGNRDRWQKVNGQRHERLVVLAMAECAENKGRFLKPLEEAVAAFCAEKTWVMPAHDGKLNNFNGQTVEMDLGACSLAWDLATVDCLMGSRLSAASHQLIRDNLERRIFRPYRDMVEGRRAPIQWLLATHNWNAVCLAGVMGAAMAGLDGAEERAFFAAAAERHIRHFLSGFTPDGYCSEGLGYWNYGFGHFLMLGETLRQATGGRIDLLADPAARAPAMFAIQSEILNGVYPSIADCSPGTRPSPEFAGWISERFGLDRPVAKDPNRSLTRGSLCSRMLFGFALQPLPRIAGGPAKAVSPLRTWFQDGGVLICRPGPGGVPFAVSLKGGHNAEHHNHNDVGSYIVVAGRSALVVDSGAEVYTAKTFSSKRYESDALNSFGHGVPVVAGQLQRTGAAARAKVLRTEFSDSRDELVLDLTSAYAVPALTRLERAFTFQRSTPVSLMVRDEAVFWSPQAFETALITWGDWKRTGPAELEIKEGTNAVRVGIDTGGAAFEIKTERLKADYHARTKPERLAVALKEPAARAVVTLTITPVSAGTAGRDK